MSRGRGIGSVSDRTLRLLLRVSVLALVVVMVGFGAFYYLTQHVSAPPSLVDQQVTSAEAAVRKAPGDLDARIQLAAVYQADKRLDDALTQYDEVLKAQTGNKFALLGRGYVYLQKGDLSAATKDYQTITGANATGEFAGADPQVEEAHYYLGVIAVMQQKPQAALTDLNAALKIDATDSDALYQVGLAQLQMNQPKVAIDAFTKALVFVPTGWCEPYTQLASAYTTLGQKDEASYASAMATYCKQKPAEGKTQLQALTNGPAKVDAMLGLALIAQVEGKQDDAVAWYKKVLVADKTSVPAMSALAQLGVGPAGSKPASSTATPTQGSS